MYSNSSHTQLFSQKKNIELNEFRPWKLARKSDLEFPIEGFGFSNINNSGRKFAGAILDSVRRARAVHPCNNRGSCAYAFEMRL